MNRPWEGADSLVGLVGNMSLGNGKMGGGMGRTAYYAGQATSNTGNSTTTAAFNMNGILPHGIDLPPTSSSAAVVTLPPQPGAAIAFASAALPPPPFTASAAMPGAVAPSQMGAAAYSPHPPHHGYTTIPPHRQQQPQLMQGYTASQHTGGYPAANAVGLDANAAAYLNTAALSDGTYMVHAIPNIPSMGWGGQTIQDAGTFKAPWFGKSRGRGTNGNGNGGRSRHRNGHNGHHQGSNGNGNGHHSNGRRNGRRNSNWSDALEDGIPEDVTVDTIIARVSKLSAIEPINDAVYQMLFQLEGRTCALLLKELARARIPKRAVELFDWVRELDPSHPLQKSLLDVFSYTAAISLCIAEHDVERAVTLANEMNLKGIERNVHTYTALMNVCIKCSKYPMALETYRLMRAAGCPPNVVTCNTLIDVHGKMGAWEDAIAVVNSMKSEGIEPVLRTYNTLLIACNMCNQPKEAVNVYKRMLDEGFSPNSTTYNALISAYGKAGQLDRVMEVFQEMMYRGCERSVITYSSLISACEKAGQWELALELFQEMIRERCQPNTVTFNSLITALGQGAQWEKAQEVFEQMQIQGCSPDVVTYTALISSLEKGGQWRSALDAFERMRKQGCRADSIVYNAIIDSLWETGVVWAQRKALSLFRTAVEEGHFAQGRLFPGLANSEVNLHAMTAGVAVLCLYAWLLSLKQLLVKHGPGAVPATLAIITDRGRGAKEQGNLVVKEAVAALMSTWGAPFKALGGENGLPGSMEASGAEIADWILSDIFEANIFAFFPCTDILPTVANSGQSAASITAMGVLLDDHGNGKEITVEQRCSEAFAAVHLFEKTHCLTLQNMGLAYLQRRGDLVNRCIDIAAALGIKQEAGHDAVLLMDRVMSTNLNLASELLDLLAAACVFVAARQVDGPSSSLALPSEETLLSATGLPLAAVEQMEWNIRQVLEQDTAAISTLRCLKLYLERLGAQHLDQAASIAMAGTSLHLVSECASDMTFLNCRPSVIAAAVMYTDRRARGVIPFWPTMLAKLTGYQDMSTPELSVAIKAAQRKCCCTHGNGNGTGSNGSKSGAHLDAILGSGSDLVQLGGGHFGSSLAIHHEPSTMSIASTSTAAASSVSSVATSGMSTSSNGSGLLAADMSSLVVPPPIGLSQAEHAALIALRRSVVALGAGDDRNTDSASASTFSSLLVGSDTATIICGGTDNSSNSSTGDGGSSNGGDALSDQGLGPVGASSNGSQ